MRKAVNPFRAISFGNDFGIHPDQVVRNIILRRFHFGKQSAVLFIQKTGEEKIPTGLDFVPGIVGMIDFGEEHRKDVIVYYIL